jgi:hypothetical protein
MTDRMLSSHLLEVVTALWHEIDHGDGSRASSFFTEDAELTFERATFTGRAQIDGVYASRTSRGPRVSRHLVTNLHVVSQHDDTATAMSCLLLFAEDGVAPRPSIQPILVADIVDVFHRVGDDWLIASRRLTTAFQLPTAQLAVPTE